MAPAPLSMGRDPLEAPRWADRTGGDGVDNIHIWLASEGDRERKERRDGEPVVPLRWRYRDGAWQRWSELDVAFADVEPPETLRAFVAVHGLPAADQELVFAGDGWVVAEDRLAPGD